MHYCLLYSLRDLVCSETSPISWAIFKVLFTNQLPFAYFTNFRRTSASMSWLNSKVYYETATGVKFLHYLKIQFKSKLFSSILL